MTGMNAEQVRMLLEVEAGTFKGTSTAVMTRNLVDGLVTPMVDGRIDITARASQALKELRSGEIAGRWLQGAIVYNYSAVWRTEYPYVNWGAVVKRGRCVKSAPGGSFVYRDLSSVPATVKELVQSSIRQSAGADDRQGESIAAH